MADPICTDASLITGTACYRGTSLDPTEQLSLLILARMHELAGIGGTDYTDDIDQLLIDAACPPYTEDDIMAARINIAFLNATTAGATIPETMLAKKQAIACLKHVPGGIPKLNRILLTLECALGVHGAYPQ